MMSPGPNWAVEIARWISASRHMVAFTGAGISTESGIPDFRSPNGIWAQSQPVYFDDFLRSATARHEYWRQKCALHADFSRARPNDGHHALAAWEASGRLAAVITQNIDGLHTSAGSQQVLELHGTARAVACLDCHARYDADPMTATFLNTNHVPPCPACGGRLKHATISFGQRLPEDVFSQALEHTERADLFLAVGSSLVVEPAASLPRLARQSGAKLVIINRESTGLDAQADWVLHEPIGPALKAIAAALEASVIGDQDQAAIGPSSAD